MICGEKYKRRIIQDGDIFWLPLAIMAKEYNRHPVIMRRWCANGFFIELGFRVRKDETGFWTVGATETQLQTFRTLPH